MKSLEDLSNDIGRSLARANMLQKLFEEFSGHVEEFLGENQKLKGVTFEGGENCFNIRVLDRVLDIYYTASFKENSKGCVECYEVASQQPDKIKIGKFYFDGKGETDIPSKDPQDPYYINNDRGAETIVLHWTNEALKLI